MSRKISTFNCLAVTHPLIASQWHTHKNGILTPYDVAPGSHKKIWWECPVADDHEWIASVYHRTAGQGCSCCRGFTVVKSNCLATTHPEIAAQWHPTRNGTLTPFNLTAGSGKKIWWRCSAADDHEWQATPDKRTKGRGCPCCRGLKAVQSNCLAATHPEIASQWHQSKNGKLTPHQITACSHKKIWWVCQNGHSWQANIANRTNGGNGCPYCNESRGEKAIERALIAIGTLFERQYRFDDCRNKKPLPFDFGIWVNNRLVLVEFQGKQHFEPVFGKPALAATKKNDAIKKAYCKKKSIPLLEIMYWQDDIPAMLSDFIHVSHSTSELCHLPNA